MINILKKNFIRLTEKAVSASKPELEQERVLEETQRIYSQVIRQSGVKGDRFILLGYTSLMDRDVYPCELADPQSALDVIFLMPRRGLQLYLEYVCLEQDADPTQAARTATTLSSMISEGGRSFGGRQIA